MNQAIISLIVWTKIEVGAMSDGAGGCNQKPLIGARASALPKKCNMLLDIVRYSRGFLMVLLHFSQNSTPF